MIHFKAKGDNEKYSFAELYEIIRLLRSPEGCPWDREQTHGSLRKPMIEEAYELVDAIDRSSRNGMVEELGDVLLQVIFHSIIGEEDGTFSFSDVTDGCARKMLFRHSHVFGDATAADAGQALANWDVMKQKEKGFADVYEDIRNIPACFTALMRAGKCAGKLRKASQTDDLADASLLPELDYGDSEAVGRLLYAVCAKAEACGTDSEMALADTVKNYIQGMGSYEIG